MAFALPDRDAQALAAILYSAAITFLPDLYCSCVMACAITPALKATPIASANTLIFNFFICFSLGKWMMFRSNCFALASLCRTLLCNVNELLPHRRRGSVRSRTHEANYSNQAVTVLPKPIQAPNALLLWRQGQRQRQILRHRNFLGPTLHTKMIDIGLVLQ